MWMTTVGALALEHRGWDGPGGLWFLFPVFWLLLLAGVVTALVIAGRRRGRLSGQRAGERRLAERYAAGEIDEEEYQGRLATLKAANRA